MGNVNVRQGAPEDRMPTAAAAKLRPGGRHGHLVVRRKLDDPLRGTLRLRLTDADGALRTIEITVEAEPDYYPDTHAAHSGGRVVMHVFADGDVAITRAELEDELPPEIMGWRTRPTPPIAQGRS